MGQFAKDWDQLKTIIRQKDDALDRQAAQLATQAQQMSALQQQMASIQQQFDAADQAALAEVHQAAADNATTTPIAPTAPAAAAVTSFVKQ